jgi:hypothetical protein
MKCKLAQQIGLGKRKIEQKAIYSAPLDHGRVSRVVGLARGATQAGEPVGLWTLKIVGA